MGLVLVIIRRRIIEGNVVITVRWSGVWGIEILRDFVLCFSFVFFGDFYF